MTTAFHNWVPVRRMEEAKRLAFRAQIQSIAQGSSVSILIADVIGDNDPIPNVAATLVTSNRRDLRQLGYLNSLFIGRKVEAH